MKKRPRKSIDYPSIAIWLLFVVVVGGYLYQRYSGEANYDECQVYDELGRGIGCEGQDFSDL